MYVIHTYLWFIGCEGYVTKKKPGPRAKRSTKQVPRHSNFIRAWRIFRAITRQEDLAKLTIRFDPKRKGVLRETITRLENGSYRYNEDQLAMIGKALRVAPRDLIGTDPHNSGDIFAVYAGLSDEDKTKALQLLNQLRP